MVTSRRSSLLGALTDLTVSLHITFCPPVQEATQRFLLWIPHSYIVNNTLPEIGHTEFDDVLSQPDHTSHSASPSNAFHTSAPPSSGRIRPFCTRRTRAWIILGEYPSCRCAPPPFTIHPKRCTCINDVYEPRQPFAAPGWWVTRFPCLFALINYDLNPLKKTKSELPESRR